MTDVRMPDGTIIQNVPDGITQTQLATMVAAHKPQGPAQYSAEHPLQDFAASPLGAITHGAVESMGNVEQAIPEALSYIASYGGNVKGPISDFFDRLTKKSGEINRGSDKAYTDARRNTGHDGFDAGRLIGNVVSPANFAAGRVAAELPEAQTLLGRIFQGGAVGAGVGAATSPEGSRGTGAAMGGAVGAGLPALLEGGAAAASPIVNKVAEYVSPVAQRSRAIQEVMRHMQGDAEAGGPSLGNMRQRLINAAKNGQPLNLADVSGESVRGLGEGLLNEPGPARTIGAKLLTARDTEAQQGAMDDLGKSISPNLSKFDALQSLIAQRAAQSKDPYEKALEASQVWSPRVQQFLDHPILKQGLEKGYQEQSLDALAEGKTFDPKNYVVSDSRGDPVDLQGIPQGAASDVRLYRTAPEQTNGDAADAGLLTHIRRGGGIKMTGAPDAQTVRQILGDGPNSGLLSKDGKTVDQWIENLHEAGWFGRGRSFLDVDPQEFFDKLDNAARGGAEFHPESGLDSHARFKADMNRELTDAGVRASDMRSPNTMTDKLAGYRTAQAYGTHQDDPILAHIMNGVPNMRALDMAKRGLDTIVKENTNDFGKLNSYGRAVENVRKSYLKELDSLNPDYAAARQSYATPSRQMEAVVNGSKFLTKEPEEITAALDSLNDSEREMYRLGAASALRKKILSTRDGANEANRVGGSELDRQRLRAVIGDNKKADEYLSALDNRNAAFKTKADMLGNSRTALRLAAQGTQRKGDAALDAVETGLGLATGNHLLTLAGAARGGRKLIDVMRGPNDATKAEIAKLLFEQRDPTSLMREIQAPQILPGSRFRQAVSRIGPGVSIPLISLLSNAGGVGQGN